MLRWLEEQKYSISTPEQLADKIDISGKELAQLQKVCSRFRMQITPYYLDLIDFDDPKDPLRKMAVPDIRELRFRKGELADPIGDTNEDLDNQPVKAITHRYEDRVLLYPTPECGGYCRYCFRRRLAGKEDFQLTKKQLDKALDYIEKHNEIHEVILTGGDPLMLIDEKVFAILDRLKAMEHVWTIRIHTRMPVWNPYRITDELAEGLKRFNPVWIVTHFNHPRELSDIAVEHIAKLVDNGIPVLNQGVLLKGVNDDIETQRELNWALVRARVKPYYMHHLDKAQGISHFRASIKRGMNILRELRGTIPGYCIPHFILDIPGGYGKIPMQYHYLNSNGNGGIIVETPFNELRKYEDGVDQKAGEARDLDEMKPLELYPEEIMEKIGGNGDS